MDHSSFEFSTRERESITATMQTMVRNGLITGEPSRDPQWATATTASNFCRSLLVYSIRYGTNNWSIRFQRCLAISIESACTNRAGDAAVSDGYSPTTCLPWRDVRFKVVREEE